MELAKSFRNDYSNDYKSRISHAEGISYEQFPTPDHEKTGRYYTRLIEKECDSFEKIKARISDRCSVTEADIEAVLWALFTDAINSFSQGKRYNLGPFGSVYYTLTSDGTTNEYRTNPKNVRIKSFYLQPSAWLQATTKGFWFRRAHVYGPGIENREQRTQNILNALETNGSLPLNEICYLNQCSHTTAYRDMTYLLEKKQIIKRQLGCTYIYLLKK